MQKIEKRFLSVLQITDILLKKVEDQLINEIENNPGCSFS
jgi:hypothetical protein